MEFDWTDLMGEEEPKLINKDKEPLPVKWEYDWGVLIPMCPSCKEYAYEEKECVFCGQKFSSFNRPKGYEDTIIEKNGYTIMQNASGTSVFLYKGNCLVWHASTTRKWTREELEKSIPEELKNE